MNRAQYELVLEHAFGPGVVVIRDLGPWTEHPTVTNDAERVVAELLASGTLRVDQKLYYYDSGGNLDQLRFDADGFIAFAAGPREEKT